jgi:hypothetical protein
VKSFKQVAVDQSSEQKRAIDLAQYLQEIMSSLHPTLKRTQHQVEIQVPEGLELETYPGALYQIVVNLVFEFAAARLPEPQRRAYRHRRPARGRERGDDLQGRRRGP